MGATGGQEVLGNFHHIDIDDFSAKIYIPITIRGSSSDGLSVPHTFYLHDDDLNIDIEVIESENNEFEFVLEFLDKTMIGDRKHFIIRGECEQASYDIEDLDITFTISDISISESVLFIYNQLKDALDDVGIMTDEAEGLTSLVELIGEI